MQAALHNAGLLYSSTTLQNVHTLKLSGLSKPTWYVKPTDVMPQAGFDSICIKRVGNYIKGGTADKFRKQIVGHKGNSHKVDM